MKKTLATVSMALCLGFSAVAPAIADESAVRGYWQPGVATNWDMTPRENSSQQLILENHLADRHKRLAAEEQARKREQLANAAVKPQGPKPEAAVEPQPNEAASDNAGSGQPKSREELRKEIAKKHGSPDKDRPILAQKDAPEEFQAMMLALDSGDQQLALDYARRYVRYMDRLANVVGRATEFQSIAKELEGLTPETATGGDSMTSPLRLQLQPLIEQAKRERKSKAEAIDQALNDQAVLSGAAVAEDSAPKAPAVALGNVPVDPEGNVKLLVFLNEVDVAGCKALADELRAFKTKMGNGAPLQVMGLTRRTYPQAYLKKFAAEISFPFPVLNGEAVAEQSQIYRYPTFLFMAVTAKELYRMEGARPADQIEKVFRLMKGGK